MSYTLKTITVPTKSLPGPNEKHSPRNLFTTKGCHCDTKENAPSLGNKLHVLCDCKIYPYPNTWTTLWELEAERMLKTDWYRLSLAGDYTI